MGAIPKKQGKCGWPGKQLIKLLANLWLPELMEVWSKPGLNVLWSFPNKPGSAPAACSLFTTFNTAGETHSTVWRWLQCPLTPINKAECVWEEIFHLKMWLFARHPFTVKRHLVLLRWTLSQWWQTVLSHLRLSNSFWFILLRRGYANHCMTIMTK